MKLYRIWILLLCIIATGCAASTSMPNRVELVFLPLNSPLLQESTKLLPASLGEYVTVEGMIKNRRVFSNTPQSQDIEIIDLTSHPFQKSHLLFAVPPMELPETDPEIGPVRNPYVAPAKATGRRSLVENRYGKHEGLVLQEWEKVKLEPVYSLLAGRAVEANWERIGAYPVKILANFDPIPLESFVHKDAPRLVGYDAANGLSLYRCGWGFLDWKERSRVSAEVHCRVDHAARRATAIYVSGTFTE